jgi:hypothetical protein
MANKNFRVKHGLEVAGSATIENDLTITGNLIVNGDTTTLNTATLSVEDNVVILNSGVTSTPSLNAGIEVERGDATNSALTWDETADKWYQNRAGTSTVIPVNTSELSESGNLYYTDVRARTALSAGTGVSYDSGTGVISIGQAVGTTSDVTFNTVDSNIVDGNYVVGQLIATRNTSYTPPASALTTISGQNGIAISSSIGGGNGYGASVAIRYHTGDTTAAGNNAGALAFSSATGTSSAPAGAGTNLVLGAINFDGYTTSVTGSPNYAAQISTANQGAGTTAITPIQAQGYARQNFTSQTTVTTAVTGASGTGSVATLSFTIQNTAPYVVGQTVTVAGMTPSGYNGTVVITAATTSSISYANATTGFTTGGTIGAANTVTAAGCGFRVRGFANSTVMSAANRFNFMDLTSSAATFKSAAYTFADDVITGATLTQKNYMTLGATTGSINQDTFTLKNTAATTTYATFLSTGTTISGAGLHQLTRTTTGTPGSNEFRPSFNIQLSRSDQAAPQGGDGTSFRYRLNGSNNTNYTIADLSAAYATDGNGTFSVNLANGEQITSTFSSVSPLVCKVSETRISAGVPSATAGASTMATKLTVDVNKITAAVPVAFPVYTAAAANAITGAVGWQICISNSGQGSNPNGQMAFWDTTNSRWSYIHDNSAV